MKVSRTITLFLLVAALLAPHSEAFTPETRNLARRAQEVWTQLDAIHMPHNHVDLGPTSASTNGVPEIGDLEAAITKLAMLTFLASMCLCLPLALVPTALLYEGKVISKTQREEWSLETGQFIAKWLLTIFPFAHVTVESEEANNTNKKPEPSIWVCNHTSMLDVFFLLAFDEKLRGKHKRPIKSVYWKGLDANPICKVLFQMSGFIPVDMEDNGSGNPNQYNPTSFKRLLKDSKLAFEEGFDLLVLPEGQLNPWPEEGLLEVFPGAVKLAQISHRPIRMVAMNGLHNLWHADDSIGMTVTGRDVKMRAYRGPGRIYHKHDDDAEDEFITTMNQVIGYFGSHGEDVPGLEQWLDGTAFAEQKQRQNRT